MSNLYLDAYDAAVLRFWGEMLSRHHASLRRPYATGRMVGTDLDDDDDDGPTPERQAQKSARPSVRTTGRRFREENARTRRTRALHRRRVKASPAISGYSALFSGRG